MPIGRGNTSAEYVKATFSHLAIATKKIETKTTTAHLPIVMISSNCGTTADRSAVAFMEVEADPVVRYHFAIAQYFGLCSHNSFHSFQPLHVLLVPYSSFSGTFSLHLFEISFYLFPSIIAILKSFLPMLIIVVHVIIPVIAHSPYFFSKWIDLFRSYFKPVLAIALYLISYSSLLSSVF